MMMTKMKSCEYEEDFKNTKKIEGRDKLVVKEEVKK